MWSTMDIDCRRSDCFVLAAEQKIQVEAWLSGFRSMLDTERISVNTRITTGHTGVWMVVLTDPARHSRDSAIAEIAGDDDACLAAARRCVGVE